MIKIGTVNIDTSHAPSFAEILLKGDRARYTAVYNDSFRTDDEVDDFIKKYGLTARCSTLEEMAGMVDLAFIQGCDWDRHVECCRPFVNAGVPVFVDKPICGNMTDVKMFEDWAAEGKTVIGTSALRYTYEHQSFFAIPESERGRIIHVTATVGVDEFNYAIHAVETIMGFLRGETAVSCRYVGGGKVGDVPCDSYFVTYASGVTADYHICLKGWQPSTAVVMTDKTTYVYKIDSGKVYEAMLEQVCNFMEGKENTIATVDEMLMSVRIMLAGRKSKLAGGAEELISELSPADGGFDGAEFCVGYAAAQKKG